VSGGAYDYAYQRINDLAYAIRVNAGRSNTALRKAFAAHLEQCAAAAKAIEWNDSGNGDDEEAVLIRACLHSCAEIEQAIMDAKESAAQLNDAIEMAQKHGSIK